MENSIQRSQRILNVSLIFVWVANGVIGTFLALYVNELGGSLLEVSLVSAIPNIAALLTSTPWGGLSDRLNNRKLFIIIGNGSLGVTILAFVFLRTPVQLLSVYGFGSLFIAASVPALSAYVTMSTGSSGRSLGNLLSVQSIGWAIGSLTGGFLYEAGQIQWAFLTGAAASLLGTLLFRIGFQEISNTKGSLYKLGIKEYVRVQKMRGVLPACVVGLLLLTGNNAFAALFGVYLVVFLTGSKLLLGVSMAVSALLGALLSPFAGRLNDRFGRKPILVLGGVAYALFFAAILLFSNPLVVAVLWILPIYPLIFTSLSALISDFTTAAERGIGMGILNTSMSLGRVVGPLMGGTLALLWGIQSATMLALLLCLIGSIYSVFSVVEGRGSSTLQASSLTEREAKPPLSP